jgi:hypothetical protein
MSQPHFLNSTLLTGNSSVAAGPAVMNARQNPIPGAVHGQQATPNAVMPPVMVHPPAQYPAPQSYLAPSALALPSQSIPPVSLLNGYGTPSAPIHIALPGHIQQQPIPHQQQPQPAGSQASPPAKRRRTV